MNKTPAFTEHHVPREQGWGANDPYFGTGVPADFQSHLKHPSLHMLPAGHWLQIDAPKDVAKEMLS